VDGLGRTVQKCVAVEDKKISWLQVKKWGGDFWWSVLFVDMLLVV
jgi:hypothetical protein